MNPEILTLSAVGRDSTGKVEDFVSVYFGTAGGSDEPSLTAAVGTDGMASEEPPEAGMVVLAGTAISCLAFEVSPLIFESFLITLSTLLLVESEAGTVDTSADGFDGSDAGAIGSVVAGAGVVGSVVAGAGVVGSDVAGAGVVGSVAAGAVGSVVAVVAGSVAAGEAGAGLVASGSVAVDVGVVPGASPSA